MQLIPIMAPSHLYIIQKAEEVPGHALVYIHLYIHINIYIGGVGELERFILPPLTGRSASFRLRFRFVRVVRAVRAGEAKLRGRMQAYPVNSN